MSLYRFFCFKVWLRTPVVAARFCLKPRRPDLQNKASNKNYIREWLMPRLHA